MVTSALRWVVLVAAVSAAVVLYTKRRSRSEVSTSMFVVDPDDARIQPGAYVHNDSKTSPRVCLVMEATDTNVVVEDAVTGEQWGITPWMLCLQWKLAREAPTAPDYVDDTCKVAA